MGEPHAELSSSISSFAVEAATGVAGASDWDCCGSMTKVSRREAGVSKVRNSFVGEISLGAGVLAGVSLLAGTRLPFRLASIRGSIDLRRRLPPRGMIEVSMA